MPVILPPSAWDAWLDPENDDLETLGQLLVPALLPSILRPVSTDVNNVRNQGPHLTDPTPEGSVLDPHPGPVRRLRTTGGRLGVTLAPTSMNRPGRPGDIGDSTRWRSGPRPGWTPTGPTTRPG